jgi:DNA-binding MarR family transcriptional regulator
MNPRGGNAAGRKAYIDSKLSSTLEDYLKAIFSLEKKKRTARVRDIAQHMGVSKSTVSAALKSLARSMPWIRRS